MNQKIQRSIVTLFLVLGLVVGYLHAQSSSTPPIIEMVKTKHDFGVVDPGVDLVYDFPIKNVGGQNLRITRINITCGCVKDAHIDMDVIPPGKTGYLHMVWQPTGGESASETIEVLSNDPRSSRQQITVKAQIKSRFSISPAVVNLGLVERSDLPLTRALQVEKLGDIPVDATLQFESGASFFQTSSTKVGKGKWDLQLTLKPEAPLGPVDGRLVVTPNWPGAKPYNLLVLGKVIGSVGAVPDEIYVDTSEQQPKVRQSFTVQGDGVQVTRVDVRPLDADLKSLATVAVDGATVNLDFILPKLTTPNTVRSRVLCDVSLGDGKKETLLVPVALVR
jgi:hypothetical protein